MMTVLTSRTWPMRFLRIGFLTLIGWWMMGQFGLNWASTSFDAQWPRTDFSRHSVDMGEFLSGGPPKDGIPAIDTPHFVSYNQANDWLADVEPVIAVEIGGTARAYPLQILMYHEIVNDEVAGVPLTITFCPLCNAAIIFKRNVAGKILDFGTTGMLRKSDLVMYDRQTESWWQQFTGEAVVGQLMGTVLEILPSQIISYQSFKQAYSTGQVLSRETGHRRPYGRNPYQGYDRIDNVPFLLGESADPRLPPMERVVSVSHGGIHRLYPFAELTRQTVINDTISGLPVVILSRNDTVSALDQGQIRQSRTIPSAAAYKRQIGSQTLSFQVRNGQVVDEETGTVWNILGHATEGPLRGSRLDALPGGVHFAFAWLAFNPSAEIYRPH